MSSTCACRQRGRDVSSTTSEFPYSDARVFTIVGTRSFGSGIADERLIDIVLGALAHYDVEPFDVIVSGGASGADRVAELVAGHLGVPFHGFDVSSVQSARQAFRADLDCPVSNEIASRYAEDGSFAYLLRNCQMAAVADAGFAFWDGESSGTEHMIDSCEAHGVDLRVIEY